MIVYLAEKPNLGRAIAKGLGISKNDDGFISNNDKSVVVTWCFGHILEQFSPDDYDEKYKSWDMSLIPIIPEKWKLKVTSSAKKQYNIIKKLLTEADEIVNAGDPDREGQLLVDEVLNYVGVDKKPTKRVLLNALDDASVKKALANLEDNKKFIGLRNAALARSRADWVIGMNLTRVYTNKMRAAGFDGVVNVGRVMTPTMALVVRRENEIKNFKLKNYFTLDVAWNHPNGIINSSWKMPDDIPDLDEEGRLLKKETADAVLEKIKNSSNASILNIEKNKKQEVHPLPFSLSALQVAAGKKFGFDPKKVLDLMQSLYDKKFTSYPRSDCDYLPTNQFAEAKIVLGNLSSLPELKFYIDMADLSIQSRAWNDKKISAHHAIIPTLEKVDTTKLSAEEIKMYLLVAKTYIAQFLPIHQYLATKITIGCENEIFSASGKTILDEGWRIIFKKDTSTENEGEKETVLPEVTNGDSLQFSSGTVQTKETKPPTRYNPSTLLKAMKEIYKYLKNPELKKTMKDCSGIGTEATRAAIIDKLIQSNFLKTEKKYLVPLEKAYRLVEILTEEMTYPDATAIWENKLDLISRKELSVQEFMEYQKKTMREWIGEAKKTEVKAAANIVKCPSCGKPMRRRVSAKNKKTFWWGCTGYPECKTTAMDEKGKPVFEKKSAPAASSDVKCPNCGKPMIRRKSSKDPKKYWWGCSGYKDGCKTTAFDKNGKPVFDKK